MTENAKRIDAAVAAWEAKLHRETRASSAEGHRAVTASGVAKLRDAMRDLEKDLAELASEGAAATKRVADFEARAMEAIGRGNDRLAREALMAQQDALETSQRLDAEATVLRAMIAECRAALDQAAVTDNSD